MKLIRLLAALVGLVVPLGVVALVVTYHDRPAAAGAALGHLAARTSGFFLEVGTSAVAAAFGG